MRATYCYDDRRLAGMNPMGQRTNMVYDPNPPRSLIQHQQLRATITYDFGKLTASELKAVQAFVAQVGSVQKAKMVLGLYEGG